jgi:hypothetical protein
MNTMTQENSSQKKSNTQFIAMAVICIILAASLAGVTAVYLNNQSQVTGKDNTIAALNDTIARLNTELAQAQAANTTNAQAYASQIASLNQQITSLTASISDYNSSYYDLQQIVQLANSGIMNQTSFTQDANGITTLWANTVDYAGYVVIQAQSTADSTYAQVLNTYKTYNLNFSQTIGTNGTAVFPILPGTLQVIIGNVNQTASNSGNVTVTFYY